MTKALRMRARRTSIAAMRRRLRRAVLPALVLGLLVPAAAHAAVETSVVMVSDPRENVLDGVTRVFRAPRTAVTAYPTRTGVGVTVGAAQSVGAYRLYFDPPQGEALDLGVYEDALGRAEPGRPGIDISGNGRACAQIKGRFEVLALSREGAVVDGLWILFEQRCEGRDAALFGEVRIGMPAPDGPTLATPAIARWPSVNVGRAGTALPVTVRPSDGAASVDGATVSGPAPRTSRSGSTSAPGRPWTPPAAARSGCASSRRRAGRGRRR